MTIVEDKVDSDRIDADYIMDCSGKPENYDGVMAINVL